MGPQIPARIVPVEDGSYKVMAGPFKDAKAAQEVAKRMEMDLEMSAEIIPPATDKLTLR